MSNFWSGYIIVLALANIIGVAALLMWTRRMDISDLAEDGTTGHEYDGIREYNNPLPRWWLITFWGTIVFALIYLMLFPGLGKYPGLLGWTSSGELAADEQQYQRQYGGLYAEFARTPIPDLARNERAMQVAGRIFANNCAACHGSNARGGQGYPNLTDKDWLYGGEPAQLISTLTHGRKGIMPAFKEAFGEEGVREVVAYTLSLSGRIVDPELAKAGQARFAICASCHGASGLGNEALGAPNLTDTTWLHGGSEAQVMNTVLYGRNNVMPAFDQILGPERVHLMAAYVYYLANVRR